MSGSAKVGFDQLCIAAFESLGGSRVETVSGS